MHVFVHLCFFCVSKLCSNFCANLDSDDLLDILILSVFMPEHV